MAAGKKKKKGEDSGNVAQTAMPNHLVLDFLRSGAKATSFSTLFGRRSCRGGGGGGGSR